nr:hypothetical protein [uncultured Rhodoferax sp.]
MSNLAEQIREALLMFARNGTEPALIGGLHNTEPLAEVTLSRTNANVVLVREAGVPFQPSLGNASGIDPFVEWLSLVEVVQMLCPVWPVRDLPMQGKHWKI